MKFVFVLFFLVATAFGQLGLGLQTGVLGVGSNTQVGASPYGMGANTGLGTPIGGATGGLGLLGRK